MRKILLLIIFTSITWAENPHDQMPYFNEGHLHEQLVDGKKLKVDPIRFNKFVMGVTDSQIAVVNVKGMVCDFCARGIEKTFTKDPNVKKIDVDLSSGKVLIAYNKGQQIQFDDIKEKILTNGLNAIDMTIINL